MTKTTTAIPTENLILFDWLTFTSHADDERTIIQLLGLQDVSWQKMDNDMLSTIGSVLPTALTVAGAILVVTLGWRLFRNFTRG